MKNSSKILSFPQIGMKIKHIWNHHPALLKWFLCPPCKPYESPPWRSKWPGPVSHHQSRLGSMDSWTNFCITCSIHIICHGPPKPTWLVFFKITLVFRWPKPLCFMALGAHGISCTYGITLHMCTCMDVWRELNTYMIIYGLYGCKTPHSSRIHAFILLYVGSTHQCRF